MGADEQELAVLRQLQALVGYPREGLDVELKGWLDMGDDSHRADLMKAVLALANHGGGFILIGFIEENGTWVPDEANRPGLLVAYEQDDLNGLVANYAEPPSIVSFTTSRIHRRVLFTQSSLFPAEQCRSDRDATAPPTFESTPTTSAGQARAATRRAPGANGTS